MNRLEWSRTAGMNVGGHFKLAWTGHSTAEQWMFYNSVNGTEPNSVNGKERSTIVRTGGKHTRTVGTGNSTLEQPRMGKHLRTVWTKYNSIEINEGHKHKSEYLVHLSICFCVSIYTIQFPTFVSAFRCLFWFGFALPSSVFVLFSTLWPKSVKGTYFTYFFTYRVNRAEHNGTVWMWKNVLQWRECGVPF